MTNTTNTTHTTHTLFSSCDRLAQIRRLITAAAPKTPPVPPVIVLASKQMPQEKILPLLEAGHRIFGENRVAEAAQKWPALKAQFPDSELHMIGPLQTSNLKQALGLFDVLHTLARENLARKLAAIKEKGGFIPRLFVQVNLAQEPQKQGVSPAQLPDFLRFLAGLGLNAEGLSIIPPKDEDPAPFFAALALLAKRHGLLCLSMGMSKDYETATRLGATHIRVGEAVFGPRPAY